MSSVLRSQDAYDLYKLSRAVIFLLLPGREFDLSRYDRVYCIIGADADALAGNNFCSSLTYDNAAGFGDLSVMEFDSKVFRL